MKIIYKKYSFIQKKIYVTRQAKSVFNLIAKLFPLTGPG